MLKNQFIILFISTICFAGCGIFGGKANLSKAEIDGVYIPMDLEDAIVQINTLVADSNKMMYRQMTEDEFSANSHFGLGIWMRNNWQLWSGSRLSKYFNTLDIYHPDDMSGIILDSYHRDLTGKKIELEKQVGYYKNYWAVTRIPEEKNYPKGVTDLEFDMGLYYDREDEMPGFIHIQTNSKTNKIWIYDYYFGWAEVEQYVLDELSENQHQRETILKQIYSK